MFESIDDISHGDFELFAMACLESAGWKNLHRTEVGVDARYGDGGYDLEGTRETRTWIHSRRNGSVWI